MVLIEQSLETFSDLLASSAPAPGGGGTAALVAALGTALGQMVGHLTLGKEAYAQVEEEIREWTREAQILRKRLMTLVDEDAKAFAPLARAYGIPKEDPHRQETMERCLLAAAAVPMEILELACRSGELMVGYARAGSSLALSDAGCGAALCEAAMKAAGLNVLVNTRLMKDRAAAQQLNQQVEQLLDHYLPLVGEVYKEMEERMKHGG